MKYCKWSSILVVLAILFQLFSYFPGTYALDTKLIRLYDIQAETIVACQEKGVQLLEAYPTYILMEVTPDQLIWISENSWYYIEEKEYLSIHFSGHVFLSQSDKTIQWPEYMNPSTYDGDTSVYGLVQWIGPEKEEWKAILEAYHVELLFPLHQYAWLIKVEKELIPVVQQLRFVRSCGVIPISAKIHKAFRSLQGSEELGGLQITVADSFDVNAFLVETGLKVDQVVFQPVEPFDRVLVSEYAYKKLNMLSQNPHIIQVDHYQDYETFNSRSARVINAQRLSQGVNIDTIPGLDGSGEIAGVADTGIRSTHPDFHDPTFADKVIATFPANWDDYHSHGTHVAGTVAGTGAASPNRNLKGIAYNARLVSQNFLGNQGYYNTIGGLYALFQEAYNAGARTHNNSWGYNWSTWYHINGAGDYSTGARDIDRFLWDHMDFTLVKSAGNNRSANHLIAYYNFFGPYPFQRGTRTITADSNAKNLICVGATENENGTPVGSPSTWGRTSSIQRNIAWFSSTGPTHDGRIKPDVVAPGDPLMSVNRTHLASPFDPYRMMSGTSMSGPVVAGSATLVRQYYKDFHQLDCQEVSSALVKATLINGAWQGIYDSDANRAGYFPYDNRPFSLNPNPYTGFGMINVKKSLSPDHGNMLFINAYDPVDRSLGISNNHPFDVFYLKAKNSHLPLKATLVWTDYADALIPPNASSTAFHQKDLINDLHLEMTDLGTLDTFRGNQMAYGYSVPNPHGFDHINNVEQIHLPGSNQSIYRVAVFTMDSITSNAGQGFKQPYALVIYGEDIEWIDPSEVPSHMMPVQPMNFSAHLHCAGIQLQWSEPNYTPRPVSYYLVRRRTWFGSLAGQLEIRRFEKEAQSWLDNSIQWKTNYYYTVSAYDSNHNPLSHSPGIMTGTPIPPERPRLGVSRRSNIIQLNWNAPKAGSCPLHRYQIYRYADISLLSSLSSTSSHGSLIAELSAGETHFVDTTVNPGEEWYYTLLAIDSRGEPSLHSAPVRVMAGSVDEGLGLYIDAPKKDLCQGELLSITVLVSNPHEKSVTGLRLLADPSRNINFHSSRYLRSRVLPDGSIEFILPSLPAKQTSSFSIDFQAAEKAVNDSREAIFFTLRSLDTVYSHYNLSVRLKKCDQGAPAPYLSIQLNNMQYDPITGRRYLVTDQSLGADISWKHMSSPFELMIDWGDGEQEKITAFAEHHYKARHSYASPSTYRVRITVIDGTGKTLDSELSIEVRNQ